MKSIKIILSILVVSTFAAYAGCGGGRSTTAQNGSVSGSRPEVAEFAGNYAKAWSSGDPKAVARFFTEDGSLRVNDDKPAVGRAAIAEVARGFMSALPDALVTMDKLVTRPDGVVEFHWTLTGTNTGPRGTGNRVRISGFEEWHMTSGGLISASQGHLDEREYKRQIREGY